MTICQLSLTLVQLPTSFRQSPNGPDVGGFHFFSIRTLLTYLLSSSPASLCRADPPGGIKQERLRTPNTPGNFTGTSEYFIIAN